MAQAYYQFPNGRVACVDGDTDFPPLSEALTEPNGLLAAGGDLSTARLLKAYRAGIFPWFNADEPVLWWSPSPRMVVFPDELKISHSLKKTLRKQLFEIRFNTAFRAVISACSEVKRPEQNGTWINADIIDAYCALFDAGHAISAEAWLDNRLVGACYGVKIGRAFYGESMFHLVSDASKVAFVHLVQHLKSADVAMIDCQMNTSLLASLGGREIGRDEFCLRLTQLTNSP
ncbi:MAG: leucyl/phenylalanyl-tRNA--protein transferase [Methylotenera sp.]|nr:leucyl/phenylalanyl-tRNA--protein transferase [Methylotenera sp.]